jgi:hypothetical protein
MCVSNEFQTISKETKGFYNDFQRNFKGKTMNSEASQMILMECKEK